MYTKEIFNNQPKYPKPLILNEDLTNNKKKIIKELRFEKEENGIRVHFTLDTSLIVKPCYTINYKTNREYMLATISKTDIKSDLSRVIEDTRISSNKIIFGVVDLYTNDDPLWIQKIEIEFETNLEKN
jgi:hypothetical protein